MFRLITKKIPRQSCLATSVAVSPLRYYHSYPDPKEKPTIIQTKSDVKKSLDKSGSEFQLPSKFRMDELFPGTVVSSGIKNTNLPETRATVLPNGLTVATQEMPGLMSSFCLIVKTGSSYERQSGDNTNTGVAHMLELNGFRTTTNRDHMQLVEQVEKLGGMVQCIASKDSMLYCIDTLRSGTEEALDILADAVLNPKFPEEEINQSKMMVAFQDENIHPGLITKDLVNISAYRGYPLGNRHLCPLDIVEGFTAQKLIDFRKEHLFGDNCVLAASGADHDTLVKIATEKFGSLPKGKKNASPESKFVGGLITNERKMKEPFTKVAMAFEVGGWNSDLVIPVCVAQQLLGGGSSFSAGGPGKGMYSRLYTRVLNKFYWAESIEAFVSLYDKNGLFGIDGACPPENVANMIKAIMDELTDLAYIKVSDIPLTRAKNMLKSMMMMQLESRLVVCEDIARQLLTYGFRESPTIICEKIDKITADDIMRVGKKLLESPPAVAIAGESITDDPSYEDIESYVKLYRDQCEERYK